MAKEETFDVPFYDYLQRYYHEKKGKIRSYYKQLTRKYLDYNNPTNYGAFLRVPQYEALEIYIYLKEYLDNKHLVEIFDEWQHQQGSFADRSDVALLEEIDKKAYRAAFATLKAIKQDYANYIFALTMGVGKTILMATCIFYEFLLANKFPKDRRFCRNALVFAPDKTVLQSLREIETFDKTRVVPPEYVNWLDTHLKFHFLDDSGITLNTIDNDDFNLIISNTQKIILKRKHKDPTPVSRLFEDDFADAQANNPEFAQMVAMFGEDSPGRLAVLDEGELTSNQRFHKLSRLPQLGIYVDEAHHAFGNKLEKDLCDHKKATSLRLTIDELARSLEHQGTHVVACYNFTGTPYTKNRLLPEVVYSYSLSKAITNSYLKQANVAGFKNAKSIEAVRVAITEFVKTHKTGRYEGMLPKMAFFAATIAELQDELRPAIETVLAELGINLDRILVNVGDEKLTTNDEIREFNRLDTITSEKQFILLVNKGKEGWNCRSLFAVCLFRKPKSTIFVLQATMRCLRAITDVQQTGHVYLSVENEEILAKELEENFKMSVDELRNSGDKQKITVNVLPTEPPVKVIIKRRRKKYEVKELNPPRISFELNKIEHDKYRIIRTEKNILDLDKKTALDQDLTSSRLKRPFACLTLVAEIARYLNKSCLAVRALLDKADCSAEELVQAVSDNNELLYDWVIPRLFTQLYKINEFILEEEQEVALVKPSPDGAPFQFRVLPGLLAPLADKQYSPFRGKSFHLDHYCFDSKPEIAFFWKSLQDTQIEKIWFTGMLTHGQSEFVISYIDPESHTLRHYFPDFLVKKADGNFIIVEIKGDNKLNDPVVLAKKEYARSLAVLNNMTYEVIAESEVMQGSNG